MTNGNDPAYPLIETVHFKSGPAIGAMHGLTKREHFAGLAMQGILAHGFKEDSVPFVAVDYADRLIAALNKESK